MKTGSSLLALNPGSVSDSGFFILGGQNLISVFDFIRRTSSFRSNWRHIERSGAKSKYIRYFKALF